MPNYALPVQDIALGSWTEGAGNGDANAWDELDEGFGAGRGTGSGPDDSTTYWQSEDRIATGDYTTLEVKLGSVPTPPTRLQHIVRVRWRKGATGGVQVNAKFQLYQGMTAITGVQTVTNIGATWQTNTYTLTEAEASSITDYSDLRVRVWGSSIADGLQRRIWLSAIELEVPAKLTASLAGTLATAGAHTGKVKANLVGTLTTAGSLATNIIRKVTVAGTLTTAGAIAVKRTLKANLGGTLATAGAHVGKVKARLAGALATAGAHVGKVKATLKGVLFAHAVDTFNRPDTVSGLGVADSGQLWTGSMRVVANRSRASVSGVGTTHLNAGQANVEAECVIKPLQNAQWKAGLAARLTDTNNLWALKLERSTGKFVFVKRQAGSETVIGQTGAIVVDGNEYQLKIRADSNALAAYVDGTLVGSATDSFNSTATRCGFWQEGNDVVDRVELDAFVVRPLTSPGVLVLRFRQAFTGTLATSGALASRRIRKVTVTGTLATAGVLAGIKRVAWQGLRRLRAVITDAIGNIKGHILP